MNARQKLLFNTKTQNLAVLTFVALGVLAGCDQRAATEGAIAEAAQQQVGNLITQPAKNDLIGFGTLIATQLASQQIQFLGVREGVDSATVNPADGPGMSIYLLDFSAPQSSAFQFTGDTSTLPLSPENLLRQQRWQAYLCTAALAEIMRKRNIDIVRATFATADMPVAHCNN